MLLWEKFNWTNDRTYKEGAYAVIIKKCKEGTALVTQVCSNYVINRMYN